MPSFLSREDFSPFLLLPRRLSSNCAYPRYVRALGSQFLIYFRKQIHVFGLTKCTLLLAAVITVAIEHILLSALPVLFAVQ